MKITTIRREKVFGPGRQVPLDGNQKARITAYAATWSRQHALSGQHTGPITRAAMDVLRALLRGFHNSQTGACFPSYEAIAEKAGCARSTVAVAIKALEFAGVLTWQNRITRVRERCRDLFGREGWIWRVVRTSNAYVFRDPGSTSENRPGTQEPKFIPVREAALAGSSPADRPLAAPETALDHALARLGAAIAAKNCIEDAAG